MLRNIIIYISTIFLFTGCMCLTCTGNGTCYGTGKCEGYGSCNNGYGKCIRPSYLNKKIDDAVKEISYTCSGYGSCDGEMICDGTMTKDENNISYCQGKMECKKGNGTCKGDGTCSAGIGVCENAIFSNCLGDGSCAGVGACLGLPGATIDTDISLENSLPLHKHP